MARKNNDPFDFSKAKNSIPFRTPQMSRTQFTAQDILAQKNAQRNARFPQGLQMAGVSPYKAIAMYFAQLARAGIGGADEFAALSRVASRVPRVRVDASAKVSNLGMQEATSLLNDFKLGNPAGYSSKLFPDGIRNLFRPGEIDAIYRAFGKVQGQIGSTLAGNAGKAISSGLPATTVSRAVSNSIAAGRILKKGINK